MLTLVSIIITLVIVGVVLYLLQVIPMDGTIKTIIKVLVIVFVILWILQSLDLLGSLNQIGIK